MTEQPRPQPRITIPPGFDGYWLAGDDPTPRYFRAGETLPPEATTAYQQSGRTLQDRPITSRIVVMPE